MTATARFRAPAGPIACACALGAGAVAVALIDPSDTPLTPPCPWRTTTGWWCPGCGLTRATHHLLQGDVVTALRYNLFVIPVLLAIALSWWGWFRDQPVGVPRWLLWLAGAAAVAFTVLRNLPIVH